LRELTERMRRGFALGGAVAALLLGVAACGGDSTGEELNAELNAEARPPQPPPAQPPVQTPAPVPSGSAAGSSEQRAQLLPLPNSPDAGVSGQLTIQNTPNGATVELTASGLQPEGRYMAHVHTGTCAEQGGPHFKFDPAGGDMPPNEIHLDLHADAQGSSEGNTTAPKPLPAEAKSVVLHRTEGEVKVACAELGEPLAP
jgi:hypothetical protein